MAVQTGDIRLISTPEGAVLCLVLKQEETGWVISPVEPNPRLRLVGDPVLSGGLPLPKVSVAADLFAGISETRLDEGELWGRTKDLQAVKLAIGRSARALAELSRLQRGSGADVDLLIGLLPVFGEDLDHIRERRRSLRRRFEATSMDWNLPGISLE